MPCVIDISKFYRTAIIVFGSAGKKLPAEIGVSGGCFFFASIINREGWGGGEKAEGEAIGGGRIVHLSALRATGGRDRVFVVVPGVTGPRLYNKMEKKEKRKLSQVLK
jgi:hypothetical protein